MLLGWQDYSPEDIDWSEQETTNDQSDIENVIADLISAGLIDKTSNILHAGVGNSSLAKRFHKDVHWITGLTVSEREKRLADSLLIPNYTVCLHDKYRDSFFPNCGLVVDNNLAGFAFSYSQYFSMMENYAASLKVGGMILTHQDGMNWSIENGIKLKFEDLAELEKTLPLRAKKFTSKVYALVRV